MLFLPSLPTNLNGKKLELEHQNQHSQIYLKNKILNTPAFDIYEIHESQSHDSSLSSQKINRSEIIIETDNIWNNF